MRSIGRVSRGLFRGPRARKVEGLAGRLHDAWRAGRRLPGGGYEPQIRTTADRAWARRHGADRVDIANTGYRDLPADWQRENRESAIVAVRLVTEGRRRGADLSGEEFMESASHAVHEAWLVRNGRRASPEQRLPYRLLPEAEKEKDRLVVRLALELWS
ncbi:hypothetical protein [Microtetraspora malaysiensis]|uniref:hypothetical protein n=1 Tax=Microtetraspora malaysiensis TaxID=161358 RepID=UPI003D8D1A95